MNGQLEIPHARQLEDDPVLLLDVFSIAQAHDVPLTRKAQHLVRENLDLIDDEFQRSPAARGTEDVDTSCAPRFHESRLGGLCRRVRSRAATRGYRPGS